MERYRAIKNPNPKAIFIRCGDPRFRIAFRDFPKELGFEQGDFVPIDVAGGPAALAYRRTRAADFCHMRRQIEFFLGHFRSIQLVVIIGHQDCGYYKAIGNPAPDQEKLDLPKAAKTIRGMAPEAEVQSYYAKFADESREEIVFEKVG
ncbi:MAG: hypothetical protein NT155_01445 [Candidatus Staskawiczbacteria bacterium]|nr:hypothetical protein [Candidatus Staskawiczbacteria bacterium]